MMKIRIVVLLISLFVTAIGVVAVSAPASADTRLTQANAAAQFSAAGVTWSSSGGCTSRTGPTCTSFELIKQDTVTGGITLKRASGCAVNITGGTETGHAGDPNDPAVKSHWNGWKLDIAKSTCVTNYIHNAFTYIGPRSGDGAPQYRAASGNIYADEGSHWDILFLTCGC